MKWFGILGALLLQTILSQNIAYSTLTVTQTAMGARSVFARNDQFEVQILPTSGYSFSHEKPMSSAPQESAKPLTKEDLRKLQEGVRLLISAGANTLTPTTIKNARLITLFGVMGTLDRDEPELSLPLVTKGMTLQTYDRMLNREVSRRGAWQQYYQWAAEAIGYRDTDRPYRGIPELAPVLEFIRPKVTSDKTGIKLDSQQTRVTTDPMSVALYDAMIDVMVQNKSGLVLRDETADSLGYPRRADGKAWGDGRGSDVGDHRLMYAFGSLKYFQSVSDVGVANDAAVVIEPGITNGQLQAAFCALTPSIYDRGRSSGLPGAKDAGFPGLLEGRVDARTGGFESNEVPPDGLFQACSIPFK